jgi:hypothetical protein
MFIIDTFAISPQLTHNQKFESGEWTDHSDKYYLAIEPNYLELIPSNLLRRMGKAVRMGIGAGLPLIQRNVKTDGIIIGSANGGLEDCIHFLNQIVDYEEGVLTPTNFVQSTPNALAGQLALMSKNTGYNMTHVNGSLSFESAILDGILFFDEQNASSTLLIGAVEEISEYNYNIDLLAGRYKTENTPNSVLLTSDSAGSVCGEGATMFIVSNNPEKALAEIVDVTQVTTTEFKNLQQATIDFFKRNNISPDMIDLVLIGKNGDNRTDGWYDEFQDAFFENKPTLCYKNMVGEYRTSSAFATYLAAEILSKKINKTKQFVGEIPQELNYLLIYNHFDGVRHGLTLVKK